MGWLACLASMPAVDCRPDLPQIVFDSEVRALVVALQVGQALPPGKCCPSATVSYVLVGTCAT